MTPKESASIIDLIKIAYDLSRHTIEEKTSGYILNRLKKEFTYPEIKAGIEKAIESEAIVTYILIRDMIIMERREKKRAEQKKREIQERQKKLVQMKKEGRLPNTDITKKLFKAINNQERVN